MAEIKSIKSLEELEQCIKNNSKVAIKFSAGWCGPCRVMSETIKSINEAELNGFIFYEIDVDDSFADSLCYENKISSIPATIFYVEGLKVSKVVGAQPANRIIEITGSL